MGKLRSTIQKVDKCLTLDAIRLLAYARSKKNHIALVDKLKLMSTVLQTQPMLQLLLSSSDYVGALELIAGENLYFKFVTPDDYYSELKGHKRF